MPKLEDGLYGRLSPNALEPRPRRSGNIRGLKHSNLGFELLYSITILRNPKEYLLLVITLASIL